jgi:hypothetical protein
VKEGPGPYRIGGIVGGDPLSRSLKKRPLESPDLTALAVRFSYVVPEQRLLGVLRDLAPLVEIGAGNGYWAYLLRKMDTDIVAFDQIPPGGSRDNRYHPNTACWTTVGVGDQAELVQHRDRTLFVCWPPLFSSLGDCLSFYAGETVAWLGDTGFRTARPLGLREGFRELARYPARALDPWPESPVTLSIWRRRDRGGVGAR